MAIIPLAMQLLPLVPGLIDSAVKIVDALKSDPATPADAKAELEQVSANLKLAVERVKNAPLPTAG